jgi:hypothetical protein
MQLRLHGVLVSVAAERVEGQLAIALLTQAAAWGYSMLTSQQPRCCRAKMINPGNGSAVECTHPSFR